MAIFCNSGLLIFGTADREAAFHELQLREGSDLDHVVVGPGGLYCISTKGYRGLLSLDSHGELLYNNAPSKLLQATLAQAMELKDRLQGVMGLGLPYVNAVLAVPFAFVAFSGSQHSVLVLHQDDLVRTLEKLPRRLKKADIERCVIALKMLYEHGKTIHRRSEDAVAVVPAAGPVDGPG